MVDHGDPGQEALQALLQGGPHPSASLYLKYHRHIQVSPAGVPLVFTDGSVPLAVFKETHPMIILANETTSRSGGRTLLLPGETTKVTYTIATEISKKVTTSLIERVKEAAAKGCCFDNIAADNVFVEDEDGTVKLDGVQELLNLNDDDLEDGLELNFASTADIIDNGIYDGNPPPDIAHLTGLMRTDPSASVFYDTHASLVPMLNFPYLIKEYHDHCKNVIPKPVFCRILRKLPHVSHWRSTVRSNSLLKVTLDYQHGYPVPENTSSRQRELYPDQERALTELGYGEAQLQQRKLTEDQLDLIDSLKLFNFMRNRPAHRMETNHLRVVRQNHLARSSELVTKVRFPLWLCKLQHQLHKRRKLKKVNVKALFYTRGGK
ncbi:unnamed protein product [Urochloa decumbens]|uniref:Uncharacterized protein n=1 Tax=Urochloa decumbens TaxID=240449 RepID=A0ABC9GXQ9_9POAL